MEKNENGNNFAKMEQKNKLASSSIVLGVIGLCTSFIPIINNISFVLALIALIFCIISLLKGASKKTAIAGIILSIITIMIVVNTQKSLSESIDNAVNELNDTIDTAAGNKTDEILSKYLDVTIGTFSSTTDSYGFSTTELPVTVKNKSSEMKSFSIQIESVNSDGSRITTDYIYANNLGAGQSQEFKAFEYVESNKITSLQNSTFKIVEVSMY